MKKLIVIFLCCFGSMKAQDNLNYGSAAKVRKIVLDAGHGGEDTGCKAFGWYEKDNALAVILALGKQLSAQFPDIQIVYTRQSDFRPPISRRVQIANNENADLLVSVHCNYTNENLGTTGTETLYYPSSEGYGNAMPTDSIMDLEKCLPFDPADTIVDAPNSYGVMILNSRGNRSLQLASLIESKMKEMTKRPSLGAKKRYDLWVLKGTKMPSVLCEIGFLNHAKDGKFISSPQGQEQIVEALLTGIAEYMGRTITPKSFQATTFGVQLKATNEPTLFPNVPYNIRPVRESWDQLWHYYIDCASEADVHTVKALLSSLGYGDAFKVRFINGSRPQPAK